MLALKIFVILFEFASANTVRILCKNQSTIKSDKSFTLMAKVELNEEDQSLYTQALITLYNNKQKLGPWVVRSRGFYRYVETLGGYKNAILIPIETDSKILSMNLKINIQSPRQSVIESDETEKYFANCESLN